MARKTVIKKIVVGRPIKSVDATSVGNASQLASNPPSYYLDYTNFTNTPNVLDSAEINQLIATGGVDSSEIQAIIDSNYINNLLDTTKFLDSAEAVALIDSDYILARASNIQNLRDSGGDTVFTGNLVPATDSGSSLGTASKRFKDLYLSGTTLYIGDAAIGTDNNVVKVFSLDANGAIQSTLGKIALLDSSVSSSNIFDFVDSAYVNARLDTTLFLDSAETISLVDSNYVAARTFTQSDIEAFARAVSLDSAETIALIDSAYVNARLDTTAFLDSAETIALIDSAYVAARTWTQTQIEQFASNILLDSAEAARLIDSAVNGVIDGAPGALDTLNELAAALNDDSNAFNTLNNLIATKLTAADFDTRFDSALGTKTTDDVAEGSTNLYYTNTRVSTLIDSDYIIARQAPGTDSAQVEAIAAALIDSDYVAARQAAGVLKLGNVTDGALTDGAIQTLTSDTKIVDAIDELNEAMLNVSNNTFVRGNTFTGSPLAGGEGLSVTLNISVDGNANRFDVDWGDSSQDNNITDSTPTHTYSSNTGSPFTVTVRAYNTSGSGVGSEASFVRTGYIIIYTADPVANYNVYAAPTGGSPISFWEDGDTVYFENSTTNTTMADVTYRWTWGDGSSDNIIDSDNAAGGVTGSRIAHTFTASTNTDVQRTTQLELTAHTTADPTVISGGVDTSDTFEIYDDMPTPSYVAQAVRVVNGTNHQFLLNSTGLTGLGSHSTFGNQIKHYFGDGTTTTANVGSGQDGDIGDYVAKSFPLTSSNQANGVTRQIDNYVEVITNHGSSPFTSGTLSVFTEPKVVAGVTARAPTVSDGSNDDDKTVYISSVGGAFTDLNGADRTRISAIVSCQNSGNNSINFNNSENVTSTAADSTTITYSSGGWTGGAGTKNITLTASATPDTISQTDSASDTFTVKVVPTAPTKINTKSLSIATAHTGTFPRLCYNYTNNGGQTNLIGQNLENTGSGTFTRITTQNWQTNDLTNIDHQNGGFVGAFRYVNGGAQQDIGNVTTDTTLSQTGLYNQLRIVEQRDMHGADATVPSHFYKVYNLRVEGDPNDLATGLNQVTAKNNFGVPDGLIETSNRANFVKDSGNVVTIENTGGVSEVSTSARRYIGGVPYINGGSSSGMTVQGIQVRRLTTQCYTNQTNILEVDFDTNQEGTSGAVVPNTDYTYLNIVSNTEMYNSSPFANIGNSSNYVLNTVTIPSFNSNTRAVGNIKIRARNVNGISSYSSHPASIRVYNTSSIVGINETDISVSNSLGNGTYTNNGIRSRAFSADTTDNPSYTSSTNFYGSSVYDNLSEIPGGSGGTKEAGVNIDGEINYDVTDYSTNMVPAGPDRSSDTGTQYFTFAFQRAGVAQFNIDITSSGIAGCWIALPGANTDTSSTLNGWLDTNIVYNGVGLPGAGTGGNGSNGVAKTGSDKIATNTSLSGSYRMNLGTANMSSSTNNVCLVRIALTSGQSITSLGIS